MGIENLPGGDLSYLGGLVGVPEVGRCSAEAGRFNSEAGPCVPEESCVLLGETDWSTVS